MAVLSAGVVVIAVALVLLFQQREAGCERLHQTAELALGSEIRPTFFGGCRVVTLSSERPLRGPPDARVAADRASVALVPEVEAASSNTDANAPFATPPPSGSPNISAAQIEAEKSPELERCLNEGPAARGVSVAMGGCVSTELEEQDARLNAAYLAAVNRLDAAGRARLLTGELAWIRKRDAGCAEEATGGTIDLVDVPMCRLDETIQRRLVLETVGR